MTKSLEDKKKKENKKPQESQQKITKTKEKKVKKVKNLEMKTNNKAKKPEMKVNKKIKHKKEKSGLLKLIPFYKKNLKLVIAVLILSWVYAGFGFLGPVLEGQLLASFTKEINFKNILFIAGVYAVMKVATEIFINFWSISVLKLNGKVDYLIKEKMISKLICLKTKTFDTVNSGIFVARLNKDATALSELFDEVTDDLSTVFINLGFIIYAFSLNVWIALFIIIEIAILYVVNSFAVRNIFKYRMEFKSKDEKLVGIYGEILRGIRDLKNLFAKEAIKDKTNIKQKETINSYIKFIHTKRSWHRGIDSAFHLFTFGFIALSCFMISIDQLSIAAFLTLFIFNGYVYRLINSLTNIRFKITEGEVSARKVFEIIEGITYQPETFGKVSQDSLNGNIEFKNVKFAYEAEKVLFENLSFKIKKNTFVAFVGKSGEGKTSIIELMTKNYEILSGKIFLDEHNLNSLDEQSIRKNISVVSQEPYIFNMTIRENLCLSNKDASDEEIIEACKKAQIHDFIIKKEKKYESLVGENGVQLSGGQKQRIAIARAILKNSKIILLDEATSALDNESQQKIKEVLSELSKNHTIVMIAHRLSSIKDADEIFVLDNHEILAKGTHRELMKKCKTYSNLYKTEEKASQ